MEGTPRLGRAAGAAHLRAALAGKGLETVIDALPAIVARQADFAYLVVGATHPHVKAQDGESYREGLRARAARRGVGRNLLFHDRFVAPDALFGYVAAAALSITPYLGREQSASGTLAYTVGAGKAILSTPYPYAAERLGQGRGVLVPFGDRAAIGAPVRHLLAHPAERRALRERAYRYGRRMRWPLVARCPRRGGAASAESCHPLTRTDTVCDARRG